VKLAYYNHAPLVHDQSFVFDSGASSHAFTVAAHDADGEPLTFSAGSPAEVTIEVVESGQMPTADAPITAQDDEIIWHGQNSPLTNVLGNDWAVEHPPLEVVGVMPATGAFGDLTIGADGNAHYSIHSGMADALLQAGPDTFQYTVVDAAGNTATAQVSVCVKILEAGETLWSDTSSVHNYGPGSVYAWFDGAAFVRPAGGGHYDIQTVEADLDWAGDAGTLELYVAGEHIANGDLVSQIDITGELILHTHGGAAEHVVAEEVTLVDTWGRAESVTGKDRIVQVYGASGVGVTRSINDTDLVIAPYHNDVDKVVSVQGNVSAVYASEGNVGDVRAAQSIGFVFAGSNGKDRHLLDKSGLKR
jgi:VCBS repeat-containing protein